MTPPAIAGRRVWLWAAAAGVPVLSWAGSVYMGLEPGDWLVPPPALLRGLVADTLLLNAAAAIVGAPLIGVAAGAAWRRPATTSGLGALVLPLAAAAGLFAATSAVVAALALGIDTATLAFITTAHLTLAAVTLALAALGAVFGAARLDPLDAAACSLIVALAAAGGVLLLGAPVADAPRPLVDAALLASPFVAVASAAHVDILRMDLLYQISPLAHLTIEYPAWHTAALWHLAAAAAGFVSLTWMHRMRHTPLTP
jgi:hypothetical protein